MGSGIKGFKSQQALKQKLTGYTEDQSVDQQRYVTVQEMNGRRHALDTMIHGLYEITTVPLTVGAGSNIRVIKCVGHGASKNDVIRLSDGTQFSALSVPDADTIVTSVELDASPVGDTFTIWRHVTPAYNPDGSLNVVAAPSPIQYNKKAAGITTPVYVLDDQDTPANTRPIPVSIRDSLGATITLNAGDINVSIDHVNDSTKIGDGTNLVGVTASNELKTHDANVLAAISGAGTVDLTNSSTAPLGVGGVFTGSAIEIKDYSSICVAAISDVASAAGGLSMQFSPDGVNWDHVHAYDVAVGGVSYTQASELRYFRIVYTNGATAQAYFRLTTILKRHNVMPSRYTFDQGITGTQFADNVKAVIHGLTTGGGGGYVPVKVKPSGALTVEANVTSSALPTGAATEVTSAAILAELALKADLTETQPVSVASLPLPSGAATEATLATLALETTQVANGVLIGAVNEAAPVSDTASSGLNGRLQRIAQRVSSLISLFPSSIGQKAMTDSLSVTIASDQANIPVSKTYIAGTPKVNKITVGLTEVRATTDGLAPSATRNKLLVKSNKDNTGSVFLIATGGSTSTGLEIIGPDRLEFLYDPTDYYLISDTAAQVVEILEVE